jgi:imidazolonepropionase-like amidohydrolase
MINLQRRSSLLLLRLHPLSFRERFAEEMLNDYENLSQALGSFHPTIDLLQSLIRQWTSVISAELWPEPTVARPALLAGQYALGFQEPLTPVELLRGFALSVLLFSAFWTIQDPVGISSAFSKMLSSAFVSPRASASAAVNSPHKDLKILDVTIVDVEQGKLLPHRTVSIEDGIITSVVPANDAPTKAGAEVIDASGKFLIPGLWDMHTHITHTDVDFPLYIANGVLGIRSMGGVQDDVFAWQSKLKDGSLFGPMAFVSGPILDGPHGPVQPASYGVRIASAEEGRAEVDTLKSRGADFVKVYDGLSRESYFAIAAEANKLHFPFAGHVPDDVTILEAVHAGQRSIEHEIEHRGESTAEQELMERRRSKDFMAEAMKTGNYTLIPDGIAGEGNLWLKHFSQERADALYGELAHNGTSLCPTLVTSYWVAYGDQLASKPDVRQRFIDPKTLVYWQPSMNMLTKYRTPAYADWVKVKWATLLKQIPRQQALGVQLLAGTDLTVPYIYPGSSVHDEIRMFALAGLTQLQALQTATRNPVHFFGLQNRLGTVEPGKGAELVLLDGNPLMDLRNLDRIQAVITHGKILRKTELAAMTEAAANAVKDRASAGK